MSNDAQKWLDKLTESIETEEEYLRTLYGQDQQSPYCVAECLMRSDSISLPRGTPPVRREDYAVFIGGHLDSMKVHISSHREEVIRVPIPIELPYSSLREQSLAIYADYHTYYRRTVDVGTKTVVFWLHSDILAQGEEVMLRECFRWVRDNGFS